MKNLYRHLEAIPLSKKRSLTMVAASTALIPLLINLLFTADTLSTLLNNQLYFVSLGWGVYVCWLWLLYIVQKKDPVQLRHLSLTKAEVATGAAAGFAIFLLVQVALAIQLVATGESLLLTRHFASFSASGKALGIFTFNILLSAFVEELLFRVYLLPQTYLLLRKKTESKAGALLLAVVLSQLLFALMHLPRDLFRYDVEVATLISTQAQLFMSGLILALVYLRTKNLLFLSVFHAFMNWGLPLLGTEANFKLFYMIGAFALALFWGMIPVHRSTPQLNTPSASSQIA